MVIDIIQFVLLCLSILSVLFLINYTLNKKPFTQLQAAFFATLACLLIMSTGVLLQSICYSVFGINPIHFENFIYIGTCLLPVAIFFTALIFEYSKIKFKKRYLLLFVIPIISILMVWTNDWHHLFYKEYSFNLSEMVFGAYFPIYTIYTYGLLFVSIVLLIRSAVKTSGFFSVQTFLIVIGTLIPVLINLLGYLNIIDITVYMTPISFTIGLLFYAFAIFKFKFLSVAPIALQRIVDRMSDSYIVLNDNNIITDFNNTFLTTFNVKSNDVRNCNIVDLLIKLGETNLKIDDLLIILSKVKNSNTTSNYEKHFESINKYFNIEINSIQSNDKYIGTLILLKDITQHIEDMNTIKANQDLLVEKERLASLGQLVGGIAHNLKTPIMSIAGAAEGLTDLVKEYDSSIDDPEVTHQDHHEIAHDMDVWIEKIKTHASYMSDVITAVKGQAVNLNEDEQDTFTIDELMKRVNILMKHELKNALIDLNINTNSNNLITLHGNVNGLVQVINNLISNAIQAYNGVPNKSIDLTVTKKDSEIIISVQDYGCGIPKEVQDKLFKEMITTKGKNGTGLGLFMSYSTIRGHFDGNITFESKEGFGTRFDIILPL